MGNCPKSIIETHSKSREILKFSPEGGKIQTAKQR